MYGFSWMPSLEQFLHPDAAAEDAAAASYNRTLAQDRNLYNPAAVELMSQMYHIDPYASIVHSREDLGDWDYASIRTQQVSVEGKQRSRSLLNLSLFSRANAQDNAWANEQVKKGVALAKEKKYEGAIKYYSRALSIVPGHVDALVARGAAYANASTSLQALSSALLFHRPHLPFDSFGIPGSYQRAIQDFEQALTEDPSSVNAAEYLAATKRKLGFTPSTRPLTPQKELSAAPTESVAVQQSSSDRKTEQA
jgi:tetratricopeptide (TPR) repeat protein